MRPNTPLPLILLLLTIGMSITLPNMSLATSPESSDQDIATAAITPTGKTKPVAVSEGPAENYAFPALNMLDETIFQLETVHFDLDSYELTDEARGALERKVHWINAQAPDLQLVVVGHCDERGPGTYNRLLGALRAFAVKRFLMSRGLAKDRIRIVSAGEEYPMVPGESESIRAINRRAEIVIE